MASLPPAPSGSDIAGQDGNVGEEGEEAAHDDGDDAMLEGMRAALADLDGAELAAGLAAHGLPDGEDRAASIDALARAMLLA